MSANEHTNVDGSVDGKVSESVFTLSLKHGVEGENVNETVDDFGSEVVDGFMMKSSEVMMLIQMLG